MAGGLNIAFSFVIFGGFGVLIKKYAMPVAYMDKVCFTISGRQDARPRWLQLIEIGVPKGRFVWVMRADDGTVIEGNTDRAVPNPLFPGRNDTWIKPSIPITLHTRDGMCRLQLVFQVPNACYIKVVPPKAVIS